ATDADVDAIQQVMIDTGAVSKIGEEIERLLEEALHAIDTLPDVNGSRAALRALADFVVDRDT
ncbi:MAG: polyprenyl synthetase family protein, partial [Actinobacteria bacterium]|nr:polyprenyl synthetase family protein [Actinomycetota bacterium]